MLLKLEEIDDDADEKDIGFVCICVCECAEESNEETTPKVKISDETLAYEYGLEELPALVYYRKKIPIVYSADLENEKKVLDWLVEFRDTVDDPDEYIEDSDEIEDVSANVLQQLIENTEALAVLFCMCTLLLVKMLIFCVTPDDDQDQDSMKVLKELENIDDECDQNGIAFVKIGECLCLPSHTK